MKEIFVVVYSDYDTNYKIIGYSTEESQANKCKEWELRRIKKRDYGENVEVVSVICLDDIDFTLKKYGI